MIQMLLTPDPQRSTPVPDASFRPEYRVRKPEDFDRVKLRALPMYKLTDKNEWLKAQKK